MNLFNKTELTYDKNKLKNIKNILCDIDKIKIRFKTLLYELEKLNIKIPVSLFAFAKLYDTILSQREKYEFDKDYDDIQLILKALIKKNMSWGDFYTYFR